MKNSTMQAIAGAAFLSAICASQAATVSSTVDFLQAPAVSGGINSGGLSGGGYYNNGADELNLLMNFADGGSTFTAVLTLSGVTKTASNPNRVYRVIDGGIQFDNNGTAQQESLTMTVGSITHTGGPNASAVFDGYTTLVLASSWNNVNDHFTFGGETYTGPGGNPNLALTNAPVANGSAIVVTGNNIWELDGVVGQFTVSPVPEPSSLLMGLAGLGFLFIRRR